VNDAERLRHDPTMRWIVGGKAAQGCAASPSQMGRFETQWLAAPENLSAIADLSGQWIDLVHFGVHPANPCLEGCVVELVLKIQALRDGCHNDRLARHSTHTRMLA
jgi:hypothetical protein